jgi:hypothetical protein
MSRVLIGYFSKPEFVSATLRIGTFKALADGALKLGTVLDQSQKSEGTGSNSGYRRDVLELHARRRYWIA